MNKYWVLFLYCLCFLVVHNIVYAADFYVDSSYGSDANIGHSPEQAWKSIAKVNESKFVSGDVIRFKKGDVWQETLIIKNSGTSDKPIFFTSYGEGSNPKIKCSDTFSSWQLVEVEGSVKIWRGLIDGVRNPFGALRNNTRVPMYYSYDVPGNEFSAPENLLDMKNGFFYAPFGKADFYLRFDAGNPGTMEIGAREFGVLIEGQKFIVVDSIDVSGPEGEKSGHGLVSISSCDHIFIKNCTLSFNNTFGAVIKKNSTNCVYENVRSYGHKSTGLYFWEAGKGNKAINCEVYNCGGTLTDSGDMGLIGIFHTEGVLIENCNLHDNGNLAKTGSNFDAALAFVQSPNGIVKRTLIKNTAGTALQFAENSDGGLAAYNIIDGWGTFSAGNANDGLRIGGGASGSTAKNCSVYNNLFINGGKAKGEWGALRIFHRENDGLRVINNIFYNNSGVYEIFADSKNGFQGWVLKNNLFYRLNGDAINWSGKKYDYQHVLGEGRGFYSFNTGQESNSLTGNPLLIPDGMGVISGSPCIDNGVDVGLNEDYFGNPVPSGDGIDIGPFEYQKPRLQAPKLHKLTQ